MPAEWNLTVNTKSITKRFDELKRGELFITARDPEGMVYMKIRRRGARLSNPYWASFPPETLVIPVKITDIEVEPK